MPIEATGLHFDLTGIFIDKYTPLLHSIQVLLELTLARLHVGGKYLVMCPSATQLLSMCFIGQRSKVPFEVPEYPFSIKELVHRVPLSRNVGSVNLLYRERASHFHIHVWW